MARMGTAAQRSRRSSTEVRALILRSAQRLFAARGYPATTTRDIAQDAEVTEAAIYRHFGTKEALFDASIATPYHEVISSFLGSWQADSTSQTNAQVTREFVERFYDFLQEHRELVFAYLTYSNFAGPVAGESVLSRELRNIEQAMAREADERGFVGVDLPVAVRCAAGLVLALALHDDLLFPPGPDHPGRDRVVREVVAFSLRGIESRER